MKVKVFLFIFVLLLLQSEAFISINIDPEDLDQVSDFFQTININQQPHPINFRKCHVFKVMMKKTLFNTVQLIGVMFSLVGANIISTYLTPSPSQTIEVEKYIPIPNQNITNICNTDYGCNNNLCWKTCNTINNGKKTWCYNSPTIRKSQFCAHANECNICWDCLEVCHT